MSSFFLIIAVAGQLLVAPVSFASHTACVAARAEATTAGLITTACTTTI